MENTFILFYTNTENTNHLKEEIKNRYPFLRPSFSNKNFLSYKSDQKITLESLFRINPVFARRVSLFKEKVETLPESGKYHHVVIGEESVNDECNFKEDEVIETYFEMKNAIWIGLHKHHNKLSPFSVSNPSLTLPSSAPSRAYLKIAEAIVRTSEDLNGRQVLELGSSPGGASQLLLEKGARVIGVDPAKMDQSILDHNNFTHLEKPVQKVNKRDIHKKGVSIICNDMNIPCEQSINETLRLAELIGDDLETIYLTIKLPKAFMVKFIRTHVDKFRKAGFKKVNGISLVSHRNEYLLIAKRA